MPGPGVTQAPSIQHHELESALNIARELLYQKLSDELLGELLQVALSRGQAPRRPAH